MLGVERITDWLGQEVRDSQGESLGKLEDVYCGSDGDAQLALVKYGLLGRKHALVPLDGAVVGRDYVRVAFPAEFVQQANDSIDASAGEQIGAAAAQQLAHSYGVQMVAGELESVTARREREAAAQEAEQRAVELEQQAREQSAAAEAARAAAEERSGQAEDAQQAARRAREDAGTL